MKDLQTQLAQLLELPKPFDFNQLLTLERLKIRTVDIENELASVEEVFKTYKQKHLSYVPPSEEATDEEIARLIKEEQDLIEEQSSLRAAESELQSQLLKVSYQCLSLIPSSSKKDLILSRKKIHFGKR